MEIPEKLLRFKFHLLFALLLVLLLSALIVVAPRFLTILAYFWPLLLSTALFLAAVVVFGKTTPPPPDAVGDKAGEGLLDYVAGPEQPIVGLHENDAVREHQEPIESSNSKSE